MERLACWLRWLACGVPRWRRKGADLSGPRDEAEEALWQAMGWTGAAGRGRPRP